MLWKFLFRTQFIVWSNNFEGWDFSNIYLVSRLHCETIWWSLFSGNLTSTGFSIHKAARNQQYDGLFFQVTSLLQGSQFMTQREITNMMASFFRYPQFYRIFISWRSEKSAIWWHPFSGTHNSTGFSFHDAARTQQYDGLFFQLTSILQGFYFMTQRELSNMMALFFR